MHGTHKSGSSSKQRSPTKDGSAKTSRETRTAKKSHQPSSSSHGAHLGAKSERTRRSHFSGNASNLVRNEFMEAYSVISSSREKPSKKGSVQKGVGNSKLSRNSDSLQNSKTTNP